MAGLWAVFVGLQFIGAAVPDRVIAQQIIDSAGREGAAQITTGRDNLLGHRDDRSTDCVAFGTGLAPADLSLAERALEVPRLGNCRSIEADLAAVAVGDEVAVNYYLRYWAGYAVVFRPALALGGVPGMVAVGIAGLVTGLFALWTALSRRLAPAVAAAFTLPVLLGSDALMTAAGSSVHALSLGVAFAGTAAVCLAGRRGLGWMTLAAV
ncbi:MAG: hypothetical protein LBG60_16620, partial [Bifidobacteriaceae bacterium]|nr:hypothetical protein [Bifidobacteriaceae bacterium]